MSRPQLSPLPIEAADAGGSSADCYSAGDRRMMDWWKSFRERRLAPILRALGRVGATADRITLLGLLAGLAFCALWTWSPALAILALAVHLALDGLDGPLARLQGTASRRGSFTDSLCDQAVVTGTTITLAASGLLAPSLAIAYVFLYTVAVTFSMVRNALGVPYSWLLRPRFAVYASIPADLWIWPGMSQWVVLACLPFLLIAVIGGALRLRSRL